MNDASVAPTNNYALAGLVPRSRLLTAALLLCLVLLLLWQGSTALILMVFAAIALGAAWEWAGMCPGLEGAWRWPVLAILAATMLALYFLPTVVGAMVLAVALLWWALALGLVLRYPSLPAWLGGPLAQALIIGIAVVPAWLALSRLATGHRGLLLVCLSLVWAADSAAYLVGRRLGSRKLCPQVSPGKTVEGLVGGLVAAAFTGLAAGLAFRLDTAALIGLMGLTTLCAALSVVGDLAESLFKRRAGMKDSGAVLPGHGGVLDRIDALLAAAPLFALAAPLLVGD